MSSPSWKWFIEYTSPSQAHMHGIDKYVYCGRTEYQFVEIVDTEFYGRCLILDGKIQSAEYDEYIYHEVLIQPSMIMHDSPQHILVIGGGEGAVLREILRHSTVKRAVMVDIDREVVELCKKYLPSWHGGAFLDPRVEVLYMDARKYLRETSETFDVIFIDLTEPVDDGPSYLLFTRQFYQLVAARLGEKGLVALQAGSFNPRLLQCHGAIYNTLKLNFKQVHSYHAFIPSYDSAWGFIMASQVHNPREVTPREVDRRLVARGIKDLRFYDGETHCGIFSLPKDIRRIRDAEHRIIEDDHPLFTY